MFRLLIADDEPLMRRGIRNLIDLSNLGIKEIFEAETGEEALQIFEEIRPEIVLLDINMPKIDGLTAAKKIKQIAPNTKIAIITGYNYFDYAQTAIKIGVEDYILKPISKSDVSEIIAKLVYLLQVDKKNLETERLLQRILKREEGDESRDNYRELIQNMMESRYSDSQFSLVVLSEKLDLSQGYLSVMFKRVFGIPFQDYLLQKRMEKAKILLLTTELKNYEIAEQIGFEDVNYFGMKFKKYYGVTPKQYKERVIQNENK
ncbi:MAG: response regulator transcription factor [Cetobacterium sp.]|uniref:response regulator transcription factor n=1 Tax=Cetobacterium sp. TaxID=2071632 RepID=UPI003F38620B